MHLLVPGAYQQRARGTPQRTRSGLNAPSDAGCLPTPRLRLRHRLPRVSMHLLMPGAYRPMPGEPSPGPRQSQYTVWCWVLIDQGQPEKTFEVAMSLNTPCGAGCLSTVGARGTQIIHC